MAGTNVLNKQFGPHSGQYTQVSVHPESPSGTSERGRETPWQRVERDIRAAKGTGYQESIFKTSGDSKHDL